MYLPDGAQIFDLNSDHYGKIGTGYNILLNQLGNIPGLEFRGSGDDISIEITNGEIYVKSNELMKIKGVGFDVGGDDGPIDICLRPDVEIIGVEVNGDNYMVIKRSETSVCYLKIRNWTSEDPDHLDRAKIPATVLSAYHYDFDLDIHDRHPVFHVQYEPSSIEIGSLTGNYHIDNREHVNSSFPNHPRVPSAPLDFTGVLFTLLHEHKEDADGWPQRLLRGLELVPKIPQWCFDPSPQLGTAMLPEWWYLHEADYGGLPDDVMACRIP